VKDAEHMKVLARVVALYSDGLSINRIAKRLNDEEIAAQRGGIWHARAIANILAHEGCYTPWQRPKVERICDSAVSAARARELAAQGYSLRQIAERLTAERHVPQRASAWHAATVRSLLRRPTAALSKSAAEVARDLRDAGQSFRQIGRALSEQGYAPLRGGRWHPATVMSLLSPA
jgi:transposase